MDPLVLQQGEAKAREPEADIRTALYETILLFCSTRQSRCVVGADGTACLPACLPACLIYA